MQEAITLQSQPRAWLEGSILRPCVSQYGDHLQRRRYAVNTQRAYVCCLAHFAYWLTEEGMTWKRSAKAPLCAFSRTTCRRAPAPSRSVVCAMSCRRHWAIFWRYSMPAAWYCSIPQFRHRTGIDALRCPHVQRLGGGGQHLSEALPSGRRISCRAFRRAADLLGDNQRRIHSPLRPWQTRAKAHHHRRDRRHHWLLSPLRQHVRRPGG